MANSRLSKKIIFFVLIIVCLSLSACKNHSYDWDTSVQEYVSAFNCELVRLDSYKDSSSDSIIYRFQTDDNLQITFDVRCFWGYTSTPFGVAIPIKKAKIVDNFEEQIYAYVSKTKGEFHIEDKSVEDISAYVLDTIRGCETLFREYGIENGRPEISFTLIRADKTYTFKYGNTNEILLRDKLTELLYM